MIECLLCGQLFVPQFSFVKIFSKNEFGEKICLHCQKKFEKLGQFRCSFCDKSLDKTDICSDCLAWKKIYGNSLLKNHSVYRYNRQFHDLMVAYKRYGDYALHQVLEELIKDEVSRLQYDFYVPVPTSPEHRAKRQFDTVSAIYEKIFPLSYFLKKKENTGAQGEKNKQERLKTPQGFFVDKKAVFSEDISEGRLLLLDDIYTTGRTLYHARDKLLEVFPKIEIESFSICR